MCWLLEKNTRATLQIRHKSLSRGRLLGREQELCLRPMLLAYAAVRELVKHSEEEQEVEEGDSDDALLSGGATWRCCSVRRLRFVALLLSALDMANNGTSRFCVASAACLHLLACLDHLVLLNLLSGNPCVCPGIPQIVQAATKQSLRGRLRPKKALTPV